MSTQPPSAPARGSTPASRVGLGLILLFPAALMCALTQLWPTLGTVSMSFQDVDMLRAGRSTWVGGDNYAVLFEQGRLAQALGFALLLAVSRVIAVAVVPPVFGWAISRFRGGSGALLRGLASLPALFYLPGAFGLAWLGALQGLRSSGAGWTSWLVDPASAPLFMAFVDGLAALAFGISLGAIVFGAAARSSKPRKWMLIAWLGVVVTAVALALQVMDLPLTLTNGGPAGATTTPLVLAYRSFAQFFQLGPGAAATTLVLVPTLLLGLIAGLVIALTRPRIETVDDSTAASPSGLAVIVAILGAAILLVVVATLAWIYLAPLLGGSEAGRAERRTLAVWSDSLLSPFAGVAVNLVLALLGGYAIGGLKPLGRQSLWLLVPFAPWLFVAPTLHVFDWFLKDQSLGVLGTWVAMIPPGFNVAALMILAVAFFGVPEGASARARGLPLMIALAIGALAWQSSIYDYAWQALLGGPRASTWLLLATQSLQSRAGIASDVWGPVLAPAIVIGLFLIAWAVAFGHRLRLNDA